MIEMEKNMTKFDQDVLDGLESLDETPEVEAVEFDEIPADGPPLLDVQDDEVPQ